MRKVEILLRKILGALFAFGIWYARLVGKLCVYEFRGPKLRILLQFALFLKMREIATEE